MLDFIAVLAADLHLRRVLKYGLRAYVPIKAVAVARQQIARVAFYHS